MTRQQHCRFFLDRDSTLLITVWLLLLLSASFVCSKRKHKLGAESIEGSDPVDIRLTPKNFQGKFGHEVELVCRTNGGQPRPVIQWFKNGALLASSSHVEISSRGHRGSQLYIRDARDDDTGSYTCRASNVFGLVTSSAASVVIATPTLTNRPYSTLCRSQHYCHNMGTCYQLELLNITYCECDHPWTGPRCMTYHVESSRPDETGTALSNVFGLVALVLAFIIICLLIYIVLILFQLKKRLLGRREPASPKLSNEAKSLLNGSVKSNQSNKYNTIVRSITHEASTDDYDTRVSMLPSEPLSDEVDGESKPHYTRQLSGTSRNAVTTSSGTTRGESGRRTRLSATSETPELLTPDVGRVMEAQSAAKSGSLYKSEARRNSPPTANKKNVGRSVSTTVNGQQRDSGSNSAPSGAVAPSTTVGEPAMARPQSLGDVDRPDWMVSTADNDGEAAIELHHKDEEIDELLRSLDVLGSDRGCGFEGQLVV